MIIVASRERPGFVARLVGLCPGLPMTVCVDETEPRIGEYRALGVDLLVRPGESPGAVAKAAYAVERVPADVYVLLSDRCVPRTAGWYEVMTAAARPRRVAHCRTRFDGAPSRFAPLPAISRAVLDAVGWIAPPGVDHYGIDNFWNAAPRLAGVAVRTDVQIDIPDYQEQDAVRARTLSRRGEFAAQWERFRASPDFSAAVDRMRALA